jgi:hypothetical protein
MEMGVLAGPDLSRLKGYLRACSEGAALDVCTFARRTGFIVHWNPKEWHVTDVSRYVPFKNLLVKAH